MPIDVIISPELEVGELVLRRLEAPGAVDSVRFAGGKVIALGIDCDDDCPVVDTPLEQLTELFPDLQAVVVGILRDGRLFVPRSSDAMLVGDRVFVICKDDQVRRTLGIFGHEEPEAHRVVIAGGGNIGFYVADSLESRDARAKVKIIESSRNRAIAIADRLKRTVVLHGDALDQELLEEADVKDADILVGLTNDDEVNILTCVMGKRLGAASNMALINNRSYPAFAGTLGIDATVNPRSVTISTILQHVRRGRIRGVHTVENGLAEVIEAEALETSPLVGKALRDLDLPDGIRIGAIVRGDSVKVPSGDTEIIAKDHVIIFATAERVRQVEQMFRVSLEFF